MTIDRFEPFPARKRTEYRKKQHKVIFLNNNPPLHTVKSKPFCDMLEALSWEVLSHADYSLDLAPSDYHLFTSIGHAFAEQRFGSYEDVKK